MVIEAGIEIRVQPKGAETRAFPPSGSGGLVFQGTAIFLVPSFVSAPLQDSRAYNSDTRRPNGKMLYLFFTEFRFFPVRSPDDVTFALFCPFLPFFAPCFRGAHG